MPDDAMVTQPRIVLRGFLVDATLLHARGFSVQDLPSKQKLAILPSKNTWDRSRSASCTGCCFRNITTHDPGMSSTYTSKATFFYLRMSATMHPLGSKKEQLTAPIKSIRS